MRIKRRPEDFEVEEILRFPRDRKGKYFVHLLRKKKMDTLQALARVAREAGVSVGEIGIAGLKDKQGITTQYISIPGKKVQVRGRGLEVRFLGRSPVPVSSSLSEGNRFRIRVGGLGREDVDGLEGRLEEIDRFGLPGYFDDQRFGCLKHGQGFLLRSLLAGRPGDALKSLVAAPSRYDPPGKASLKRALAAAWGDWGTCEKIGRKLGVQGVFGFLASHPGDLYGAFRRVPLSIRLIHLYAYQSFLWNKALSEFIRRNVDGEGRFSIPSAMGRLQVHRRLPGRDLASWRKAVLPLPAGDLELPRPGRRNGLDRELEGALLSVLEGEGIRMKDLRLPRAAGMSFKSEERRILLFPGDVRASPPARDPSRPGEWMIDLSFRLPRGAYASLVVKVLFPPFRKKRPRPRPV